MTIVQFVIEDNNLRLPDRAFYSCGLNGRYRARLQTIVFADVVLGTSNRIIRIRSDCFKDINGTYPRDLVFLNQQHHTLGNPQGEWKFYIVAQAGQIDLELISNIAYDGTTNNIFDTCIITLDVEKEEE
jgi:hypothetical protein